MKVPKQFLGCVLGVLFSVSVAFAELHPLLQPDPRWQSELSEQHKLYEEAYEEMMQTHRARLLLVDEILHLFNTGYEKGKQCDRRQAKTKDPDYNPPQFDRAEPDLAARTPELVKAESYDRESYPSAKLTEPPNLQMQAGFMEKERKKLTDESKALRARIEELREKKKSQQAEFDSTPDPSTCFADYRSKPGFVGPCRFHSDPSGRMVLDCEPYRRL